jgi:hypothetical protein
VLPTARAALAHGIGGSSFTQRERGSEKGHGAILTTPGCYGGGQRPKIGGVGVESRRRKVDWRRRTPGSERRHGGAGVRGSWAMQWRLRGSVKELQAKKGGAVLGVRVVHATAPAPPADALRLDPI